MAPETAELLADQASAHGLSVDEYLKTLLGETDEIRNAPEPSVGEFMAAMEYLAEENVEPLPRNFSPKTFTSLKTNGLSRRHEGFSPACSEE